MEAPVLANDTIFREYDIRGVVDKDFDAGLARALGSVLAAAVRADNPGKNGAALRVGVGRDCRLSSDSLEAALIEGLLDGGVSVVRCGMGPTPQLYFSVFSQSLDGGIQVTASHNPGDQNGFKMMVGKKTLSGAAIQQLKREIHALPQPTVQRPASVKILEYPAHGEYLEDLTKRAIPHMGKRPLKLVVDGGNGVGGMIGPELLRRLGCEVIELYTEPDGRFPNHEADPTVLENIKELRARVVAEKANAGIAWDGDADRIGVVNEKGEPIFGDMLLIIYGRQLLTEVPHPTIIGDVKCSELMFSQLKKEGANTVMARTGHSLIKAKLRELNAELAGEMSGHMFFADRYFGFDDALHASARLAEILSNTDKPLSAMLADLPKVVTTPEIRMECPEKIKFAIVERAQKGFSEFEVNTLDGARITFAHGWGLVRASNTQPVLVLRFEADTQERLREYQNLVESRITQIRKDLADSMAY